MSKKQKLDLTDFLTSPLRDEETTSIITNLFNRFLSEEQSVRINGQIGKAPLPDVADITPVDLDRELNALIPALYYKTGSEERAYTFDDLVNRLEAIGVDTDNLREMLAERNYNFIPPINLDKFINYSSYYWAPSTNVPPFWNIELYPEYYVMERPADNSIFQMPVRVATDRDIRLYGKDRRPEAITVTFTDATTFTITGDQGTILTRTSSTIGSETTGAKTLTGPEYEDITSVWVLAPDLTSGSSGGHGLGDPSTGNDVLFTFSITVGLAPFQAGDTFVINITYVTGANTVALTSADPTNKGFVSNITPDLRLMYVDGVQLVAGDAVLVREQTNSEENGIYTVTSTKWVRRVGAETEENLPDDSVVFVAEGATFSGYTYTLSRDDDATFVLDDPTFGAQTWNLTSTTAPSYLNEWQTYNFWVHINDLPLLPTAVQAIATQSKRPIVEYLFGVELNKFIDANGNPSTSGTPYEQKKNVINQLPQFNLYRYDGTSANRTSPIFFYVEDPDFPVDVELQKRLKTNVNPDFIFATGIQDAQDRLLYWKRNGNIETIWTPGPTIHDIVPVEFTMWDETEIVDGVTFNTSNSIAHVEYSGINWPGTRATRVVSGGKVYLELRLVSSTNLYAGLGTFASFNGDMPRDNGLRVLFASNINGVDVYDEGINTHPGLLAGISFGGDKVLQIAVNLDAGTIMYGIEDVWGPALSIPEIIGTELTPFVIAANTAGNSGAPQSVELRTRAAQFTGLVPSGYVPFEDVSSEPA